MKEVDRLYVAKPVFDDTNNLKKWLEYRHRIGGSAYFVPAIDIPHENTGAWLITMLDTDITNTSDIQLAINIVARVNVGESERGWGGVYPCSCYGKTTTELWVEGSGDFTEDEQEYMDNYAEYYDTTGRFVCRYVNGWAEYWRNDRVPPAEHYIAIDMEEEADLVALIADLNDDDMVAESFGAIHKWEDAYWLIDSPTPKQTRMYNMWWRL